MIFDNINSKEKTNKTNVDIIKNDTGIKLAEEIKKNEEVQELVDREHICIQEFKEILKIKTQLIQ